MSPAKKKKKTKKPARSSKKKAVRKKKVKKVAKKPVRRAQGKKAKKPAKKVKKAKAKKASKKAIKKAVTKVKAKMLGKVVHYYDRIGVAIVELKAPVKLGDMVLFKRGSWEMPQVVGSIQIERMPIAEAKKGDVIGMKVNREVRSGTVVQPMS